MIAIDNKTVSIKTAQVVRNYRLRLEFSDGKVVEVDFGPYLRSATLPGIRRYLQPRQFRQFAITDGVLHWNDYDLIFPMADLYDGVIR